MVLTGLPRSRTKWFSEALSASGVPFKHEMVDGCSTLEEYKARLSAYGDCNTCFVHLSPWRWYSGKCVVITNAPNRIKEIAAWCDKTYNWDGLDFLTHLEEMNRSLPGLHVAFDDINDRIREVYQYFDIPIPSEKELNRLINTSIQTDNLHSYDVESAKRLFNEIRETFVTS